MAQNIRIEQLDVQVSKQASKQANKQGTRQVGTGFRPGGTIEERNKLISEKFRIDPKLSNIVIRNETCLLVGRYRDRDR